MARISHKLLNLTVCWSYSHFNENESHIFGFEGAKLEANNQKVDFLGDIPLEIDLRECSDNGKPIILSKTDSVVSKKFLEIAKSVTKKVGDESSSSKPNIIIN